MSDKDSWPMRSPLHLFAAILGIIVVGFFGFATMSAGFDAYSDGSYGEIPYAAAGSGSVSEKRLSIKDNIP